MSAPAQPRPPQVTLAAWMIIVGSLLVVGSVFEAIGGLRSLETREAVDAFIADTPGGGWDQETVIGLLRIASMVTAGCATAAAVLGWHVLRRHRGARVGLTVLAFPLFFAGIVTGGFMSSLVAAASLMLWLQPARDWFNGKPWSPPASARSAEPPVVEPPTHQPGSWPGQAPDQPDQPGDAAPRPVQGYGDPAAQQPPQPGQQPQQAQQAQQPWPPEGSPPQPWPPQPWRQPVRGRRPDRVLAAALITWVFAGLTGLLMALGLLLAASAPDTLVEEVERQQPELFEQGALTEEALLATTYALGGFMLLWATVSVVAAVLLVRGVRWSGTLLVVLAVGAAFGCLVMVVSSAVMVLPALAAVMVAVMVRHPDVRAWLAARPQRDDVPPR